MEAIPHQEMFEALKQRGHELLSNNGFPFEDYKALKQELDNKSIQAIVSDEHLLAEIHNILRNWITVEKPKLKNNLKLHEILNTRYMTDQLESMRGFNPWNGSRITASHNLGKAYTPLKTLSMLKDHKNRPRIEIATKTLHMLAPNSFLIMDEFSMKGYLGNEDYIKTFEKEFEIFKSLNQKYYDAIAHQNGKMDKSNISEDIYLAAIGFGDQKLRRYVRFNQNVKIEN